MAKTPELQRGPPVHAAINALIIASKRGPWVDELPDDVVYKTADLEAVAHRLQELSEAMAARRGKKRRAEGKSGDNACIPPVEYGTHWRIRTPVLKKISVDQGGPQSRRPLGPLKTYARAVTIPRGYPPCRAPSNRSRNS